MSQSKPWVANSHIWNTESKFLSYIRGGIRRGLWEKHPVKLQFIQDSRKRVPLGKVTEKNPEGLVWGCDCSLCEEQFRQSKCEVDHKIGHSSFKSMDELRAYIEALIYITAEDLQIVCKSCHKIKSYAERMGITFEEAKIAKKIIKFMKKPVDKQKKYLLKLGFTEDQMKNAAKRKELITGVYNV